MDIPVTHHDALEFPDAQAVLLTRLCEGQRATVLQLPAAVRPGVREKQATPEVCELSLSSGRMRAPRRTTRAHRRTIDAP
jgi:hypothetical protein